MTQNGEQNGQQQNGEHIPADLIIYIASYLFSLTDFLSQKEKYMTSSYRCLIQLDSKASQGEHRRRRKQPNLKEEKQVGQICCICYFLPDKLIIWLCFIEISLNQLAVFLNLISSFKLLTKKLFSLYILWKLKLVGNRKSREVLYESNLSHKFIIF